MFPSRPTSAFPRGQNLRPHMYRNVILLGVGLELGSRSGVAHIHVVTSPRVRPTLTYFSHFPPQRDLITVCIFERTVRLGSLIAMNDALWVSWEQCSGTVEVMSFETLTCNMLGEVTWLTRQPVTCTGLHALFFRGVCLLHEIQ